MTEPGWYNDEHDPALGRWHDGTGWTDHMIVKATWTGPGEPPPPLQRAFPAGPEPEPEPEPTTWMPATQATPLPPAPPPPVYDMVSTGPRFGDRYRSMPRWARIAGPIVAGLVALGIADQAGGDGEPGGDPGGDGATVVVSLDDAVEIAQSKLDAPVRASSMGRLIEDLCASDVDASASSARRITQEPGAMHDVIQAAGDGAIAYCGDAVQGRSSLLNDAYAAAIVIGEAVSSTTSTVVPASLETTPTTQSPATTAPKPTTTTRAPVVPPPPPPPVVTAPPAPRCHPSYSGACLDPNSSDYDCAGGSGNGPDYTGPVSVVGPDSYDLDSDGDGLGCESG